MKAPGDLFVMPRQSRAESRPSTLIEKKLDIPFIADLALREKQIQQNYRPVIAVHKWFARRPGTLFGGFCCPSFPTARCGRFFTGPMIFPA
jgi:hypothetical protein